MRLPAGRPPAGRANLTRLLASRALAGSIARAAVVALVLLAALWGWGHVSRQPVVLHGSPLAQTPAPRFTGLVDTSGRPFDWPAQRGKAVLVFFGYTHCPDVCPLTLAALAQVLGQMHTSRHRVIVVFVTLDPARDTAAILRAYLHNFFAHAIGLRGPETAVADAAKQWGVTWRRVAGSDGNYWIDHTAAVTLVGPHGRLLARYGYTQLTDPKLLATDLDHVLGRS